MDNVYSVKISTVYMFTLRNVRFLLFVLPRIIL